MENDKQVRLMACFAEVEDPRVGPAQLHKLEDILTIAICGVICGANDWVNIELFGQAKEEWLKTILELPNGIPSHDTFGRVFRALDPDQFEEGFLKWIMSIQEVTEGEVIAIDGKKLRRSHDGLLGKDAIWMVDAWASENQITLGQIKVEEKSNEITAIPKLLDLLMIKGCIVTIDAMGCQTKIAEKIIESGADYVLAVKENQGVLHREIEWLFEVAKQVEFEQIPHDHAKTVGKHGRIEVRQCWSISHTDYIEYLQKHQDWKNLKTIAMVETEFRRGEQITRQRRYYVSSLAGDAEMILHAVRTHWQVENSLNWILDVTFREDDSRVRKGAGPQNMAVLRRLALNLLKRETSVKRSIQGKRFLAGWDNDYLLKVLFNT
jgi:predicted transposase YbfD/YdcC